MPKSFCLLPQQVEKFKKALKNKDIKVAELIHMSTEARTKLLETYVGKEDAKDVNLLFERKLVLKNKILGIKNWASQVGEIGRYDPSKDTEVQKRLQDYQDMQFERMFNPKEDESFLADLVETKVGTAITQEEAKTLFELSKETEKLLEKFDRKTGEWTSREDALKYGASKYVYEGYVDTLKGEEASIKEKLKNRKTLFKDEYEDNKAGAIFNLLKDTAKQVADNSIALLASVDISYPFRQGSKTLLTWNFKPWISGTKEAFSSFYKTMGGENTKAAIMADAYSRPNFINGNYAKAKIIADKEEQFPTSIPARIPYLGRVFKASEAAFEGAALRMRMDLYDSFHAMAQGNGVKMDSKQVEDIGVLVGGMTARGRLNPNRGGSEAVRLLMWAPKMLKANYDVLTGHTGGAGLNTKFARKEARKNIGKMILTVAIIMAIAEAFCDECVEWDPRSSDFGKIRLGDARFDITGGAASLVTLAARLTPYIGGVKSTSTKIVDKYGIKFGDKSRWDVGINFFKNKFNPSAGFIADLLHGKDFEGKPVTLSSTLFSRGVPISIQNAIKLKDDHSADRVMSVLADIVGIGGGAFADSEKDWSIEPGAELDAFREKVGDKAFTEANDLYNNKVIEGLKKLNADGGYELLSDEDKQKEVDAMKREAKADVFKQYNFKYKRPKQ